MSRTHLIVAAIAAAALAGCATEAATVAETPVTYTVTEADAAIAFASTIRTFRVGKDAEKSLLLESGNGRWYRATLDQSCRRALPWEHAIAVDNGATNRLDKFSMVVIDGQRCRIRSLDQIADPDTPAVTPAPAT